jgi:hypothetical protein
MDLAQGRFRLARNALGQCFAEDRLRPQWQQAVDDGADALTLLREAWLPAALPAALRPIGERSQHAGDSLFWQWPGRTEGAAWDLHADLRSPGFDGESLHCYLGLPWATWLDRRRADAKQLEAASEFEMQRVRIKGWRSAAHALGVQLRVHTVCQHIEWRSLLPLWQQLGLTDLWLSHAPPPTEPGAPGFRLHPWRLLAVNVEDPQRRDGLRIAASWDDKPVLASFAGAHAGHYLSDVRLRLRELAGEAGFVVRVTEGWHFEQVVYQHQVQGAALADSYRIDASVRDYNRLLSDSRFALCPSGAGPNTLRLWEALAVGSVPVLLGVMPELPAGIAWDSVLLRVADDELATLPQRLRAMSRDEWQRRQQLGLQAFAQVAQQRCF